MASVEQLIQRAAVRAPERGPAGNARPSSGVAIVACMDARLCVEALFGLQPGEAHVLRNAGGTVTDDVLRGLIVSQRVLGTEHILLVHHTDCGMSTLDEAALRERMRAESGAEPGFGLLAFADVAADLRESMAAVRACPFLPAREHVRGFVFDVADGRLHEVDAAPAPAQ